MLEINDKAPEFTLPDSDGDDVSLSDYKGKKVVLYFYPKDNTKGCTAEACDFRDAMPDFTGVNAEVIGISPDPVKSHRKFADKFELPFKLLADENKEVVEKYGVWKEKSMYGKKYMGVERTTFIINGEGNIAAMFPKVKVTGHVKKVLEELK